MTQPLTPDTARTVARDIAAAMRRHAEPAGDLTALADHGLLSLQGQVIGALRDRPMRDFALASLVQIDERGPRGMVVVRIDGSSWTLDTVEAACLAIAVRLAPGLRGADLFADAFALASREAEQKLDGLRRFGAAVPVAEA